jgi:hypothetical protein
MGNVFNFDDKIQAINIKETIVTSVAETQYAPIGFIRGQLHYGEDGTGHQISPKYRKEGYAIDKEAMNPVPGLGTPDLFVTGDFYNSIKEDVSSSKYSFTIEGTDEKAPKLELKYGNEIYALNDQNKEYYANEILKPYIVTKLKNELGL